MATHLAAEEHHPGASGYLKVAAVLFVFTMFEVAVYYIGPLRKLNLLAPILLILSVLKFTGIGGWYMHLKMDHRIFFTFFGAGVALAGTVIIALMTLFGELTTSGHPIHSLATAPALAAAAQTPLQSPASTQQTATGVIRPQINPLSIGDPELGKEFFMTKGCVGCHMAPGIADGGSIGPNQAHYSARPVIAAGHLPNTPEDTERWLANPPSIDPNTLMPNLSLTPEEIKDLTAFLYSLP